MKIPTAESFIRHSICPVGGAPLSELERQVVRLGRADAERGDDGGRLRRLRSLFAFVTGVRAVQPLAEERLEALRRYASAVRRGGDRAGQALTAELRGLGFSADALGTATALARR